ncbi:sugar ABC transporter ATP-binding protein, partial [Dickeya dadantii]|nr:sugar ABC transporter ATP-binding protein [Dickeya dadantii]
ENIMLDTLAQDGHLLSWPQNYRQAQALLDQLGVHLNVRQRLDTCSLAEKQQILLARALSHECRFLILDEPTAPLDQAESARLFEVVRRLQADGIGIVFISHRIHELSEICDTLTVLRDGEFVSSGVMQGLSGEEIVERMLGHRLDDIFPPRRTTPSEETLLQVIGLHDETLLHNISLTLHKGEI